MHKEERLLLGINSSSEEEGGRGERRRERFDPSADLDEKTDPVEQLRKIIDSKEGGAYDLTGAMH